MPERVMRFVVGDADGHRASTWRCWTPSGGKSDVYLAPRQLGGSFKLSLHESGQWHLAFTNYAVERLEAQGRWRGGESRIVARWQQHDNAGGELALLVVVPRSAVTVRSDSKSLPSNLVWIPPAPEHQAVEIALFLTKPGTVVSTWPGRRGMGTSLVGSFDLDDGRTVWLVHRVGEVPTTGKLNASISKFDPPADHDWSLGEYRTFVLFEREGVPVGLLEAKVEHNPAKPP